MKGARLQRIGGVLLATAVALLSLPLLGGELEDRGATLEQLLPSAELERLRQAREPFGIETEPLLVVLDGLHAWSDERVATVIDELAQLAGVRSASRAVALEQLSTSRTLRLVTAELDPAATELAAARALDSACGALLARAALPDERAYAVGLPRLRAVSWDLAGRELRAHVPLLALLALGLPWLLLGSASAGVFALVVATWTTALTLWGHRLLVGPPGTLVLLVIPLLWAVATMDALHLFARVQRLRSTGLAPGPAVRAARRELVGPCLMTSLTTAVGFTTLAVLGRGGLFDGLALASAAGVLVAYVVTFLLVPWVLAEVPLGHTPRWPVRLALLPLRAARRAPGGWIVVWIALSGLALFSLPRLELGSRFPRVFSPGVPLADDLEHLATSLGTDLRPLDLCLSPTRPGAVRPSTLVSATLALARELRSFPETRAVFPLDGLPADAMAPQELAIESPEVREARLGDLLARPELARWVDPVGGHARLQLHLAPTSWARLRTILGRVESFDRAMLASHDVQPTGLGHVVFRTEEAGLADLGTGGVLSLFVLALVLAAGMRRGPTSGLRWLLALTVSLLPLLFVAAALALASVPWSLALFPLPSLLLGLSVDDSVHLLWRARGRLRLEALPAILATTALVTFSVATLATSELRANRDFGIFLAGGLVVALAADLTLLPALVTRSRRRAPR